MALEVACSGGANNNCWSAGGNIGGAGGNIGGAGGNIGGVAGTKPYVVLTNLARRLRSHLDLSSDIV